MTAGIDTLLLTSGQKIDIFEYCEKFLTLSSVMLSLNAQIHKIIDRSKRLVFVVPGQGSSELAAAAIALATVLRAQKKEVSIVRTAGQPLPPYLEKQGKILSRVQKDTYTTISIDTKARPLQDMSYEKRDDLVQLILTPKNEPLKPTDIKFETVVIAPDAVVLFGVSDLKMISDLVEQNPETFTERTLVNIDVCPGNEEYGHCNAIEIKSCAVSEVIANYIYDVAPDAMTKDVASLLLAGVMLATQNFQNTRVSPSCLRTAGQLLESGADRETVTKQLYQTKSLGALRLWGRVLARIQTDDKRAMTWSLLNAVDFEKSEADEHDLAGVVDELLSSAPSIDSACIVYAYNGKTRAIVTGKKAEQAAMFYKNACTRHGSYVVIDLDTEDPQIGQSWLAKQLS